MVTMDGGLFLILFKSRKFIAAFLVVVSLLSSTYYGLLKNNVPIAEAAQATIDSTAFPTPTSHIQSGSQTVFVSDQVGYKFFVDAPGYCVYRKTSDGGATWSSTTTVDAQTDCLQVSVWYDKWTPGSASTSIHIATLDGSSDDIWYNRLDTNGDSLLLGTTPVSMLTGSGQGGTSITAGENFVSITRATNGTIYAVSNDGSGVNDSFILECTVSCNNAAQWTETTPLPLDVASDQNILVPLSAGNIMIVQRDISANTIRSRVWNDGSGAWDVGWTNIDTTATFNTTYDVGMAVTISSTTGNVYLAYIARNTAVGNDDQIRTARYSSGSWTLTKQVVRYSEKGITNVAIALDSSNDDVYVAYSARVLPLNLQTANIYWRKSMDGMATWSYEQGPLNSSADDFYGVDLNIMSDERIYATWFDDTDNDIFGETLADIFPGVHVRTTAEDELNSADSYTQVTIDATVNANGTSNIVAGSQTVFVDDQTGYKFFRDAPGYCVYRKTSDGGATWSSTTTVDSQTDCHQITVWYDQWTPGSASSSIHILTADASADDLWYNRLTPSGDVLLMGSTPVSMTTGQGGSLTEAENYVSITRGTDGTLYAVSNDGTTGPDSFIVECTTACNVAGNWTETGTNPLDAASDMNLLAPLAGGSIMLINRDISADLIRYKIWNNTTWSASWTTIDASATENATYDMGMAVVVSTSTNTIYLAYIAGNATLGVDDRVRTAIYSGSAWTTKTNVSASSVLGLTNVSIALDSSNDDVYVAYTAQAATATAASANVLWKKSTDDMDTWSFEQGPVNTSSDDLYGVNLNILHGERLFVTWFDNTDDDIYGATLVNLPSTEVATTGPQVASLYASTTNVYIGGVFALYNTDSAQSLDVTGISITESGSIDASTDISNVKLLYEMDTVSPFDCASVSYDGTENQFGSTDPNGFSGSDGVSSFTGSTISLDTSTTLCVYTVFDVNNSAQSSSTIDISINNPATDITVSGSTAGPTTEQNITGTTLVYNDTPTLTHYHWRNDDGGEATATSKTGGVEDTSLTSMRQSSTTRLRLQVSNEGSSSTPAMQYRLEYASNPSTCDAATGWTDVGALGGDFDMSDSIHLTDATNTTNIATGVGGMTDANSTFLTPNGGVKDTSSQTGSIVLSPTQFVELEYSIVASTSATEGNTYCFRVTDQGASLFTYDQLPRANIASDVLVTVATSTQIATTSIPATNFYVGSAFVITENTGSRNVTSITIAENGSINGQTDLDNIKLFYDLDVTSPYNCASESYSGSESQFGATDTDGFSSDNGTSTFSGSVTISTTSTMCLYTVLDTTVSALDGEVIDIIMPNPTEGIVVTLGGSVSPSITRNMNGSTTLVGAILTQIHYHWRGDTAVESGVTTLTNGIEDTPIINVGQTTPVRLRIQISNEGTVTSQSRAYRLEYGTKISSCSAVTTWTDVGEAGGAFDMFNSANLTEGSDTTNIAVSSGGVTNENTTFLTPNSAVKDTSSSIASTSLTSTEYLEAEFSIQQTVDAGFDVAYCFRLASTATVLNSYLVYPELTTSPERDFEIQRGTVNFSATSTILIAGVNYIAPSSSTTAFVRITNSHYTGAGDSSAGGTQASDDVTAYILNPGNITTSFTIQRPAGALATTTRVSWEIVEFIGEAGSDNEMIVRDQRIITYATTGFTATGTAVASVIDDADVVVFITGVGHPDTASTNYNSMQSTSAWLASSNQPVFTRGVTGTDATIVSYAVVEFKGPNWFVQRSQHTYSAAGTTETESITAVNSLSRTFLHTQKRINTGLTGGDEFGHEVWLSSIGQVSYFLQSGATTPSGQTSVAWIIENTQTSSGAMIVTQISNVAAAGTPEPSTLSYSITKTLSDITNTSLFITNRTADTSTSFPRPILGATIASTTHFEIWRSDTGTAADFRVEIVEWPTAGLALRQNAFGFYVDNNALLPTDPWPAGAQDLGENDVLTGTDEPLGEGDRIRIRMSITALNATLPAGTRAFALQYAPMVTTCSAISPGSWATLGNTSSSTIWRGYNATGTADGTILSGDPPTPGDLLLTSVSDVAGTFEEENATDVNTYQVLEGEDIEYDWIVEQNGANAETYYCFRMIESNGSPLDSYSTTYPQIRTASFTPRTQNWRWFTDEQNETPTTTLAAENVAPTDIANGEILKLRITVKEIKNIARDDVRFRLQFSEQSNFALAYDVVASSTCTGSSTWCYANGAGVDNAIISSTTLSDTSSCVLGVGDGCGTHAESESILSGFRHENNAAAEYEFTIQSAGPRVNRVYYFRLFDSTQDIPVFSNDSESYPSLATEGSSLVFTVGGLASSTVVEGVTLDVDTTSTNISFGELIPGTSVEAGYRVSIDTNGTEGHQILMTMAGDLLTSGGASIKHVTGTNLAPLAWDVGCSLSATSCFGYHTSDDTLQGNPTRFSAIDTFARLSTTTLEEVSYSSQPVVGETTDIVFRIFIRNLQDAGQYESTMRFISVPMF